MPYNDAQSDAFISHNPELRQFNSLPEPVAQRVSTINDAVSYITKLSAYYQEEVSVVSNVIAEVKSDVQNFDLNSARQNLQGVYEGA